MKKILTFAIVALLMGGFCINANAQGDRKAQNAKNAKKEVSKQTTTTDAKDVTSKKVTAPKTEDWEKVVTEYESKVNECIAVYKDDQALQKPSEKFTKLLAEVEELKAKLEGAKNNLTKKQSERLANATKKLSVVYKKG